MLRSLKKLRRLKPRVWFVVERLLASVMSADEILEKLK